MCPSGRNEGPPADIVDKSSKSSSCDDGEERNEQVGDHLVANEETIKIPTENDGRDKRFGEDEQHPNREQHSSRK